MIWNKWNSTVSFRREWGWTKWGLDTGILRVHKTFTLKSFLSILKSSFRPFPHPLILPCSQASVLKKKSFVLMFLNASWLKTLCAVLSHFTSVRPILSPQRCPWGWKKKLYSHLPRTLNFVRFTPFPFLLHNHGIKGNKTSPWLSIFSLFLFKYIFSLSLSKSL